MIFQPPNYANSMMLTDLHGHHYQHHHYPGQQHQPGQEAGVVAASEPSPVTSVASSTTTPPISVTVRKKLPKLHGVVVVTGSLETAAKTIAKLL